MVLKKVKKFVRASVVAVNNNLNKLVRKIRRSKIRKEDEEALLPKTGETACEIFSPVFEEELMVQEPFETEGKVSPAFEEEQVEKESLKVDSEKCCLYGNVTFYHELATHNVRRLCEWSALGGEIGGGDEEKILLVCGLQGDEKIEVENNILGQGGFGTVRRGTLITSVNCTKVAIKSVKLGEEMAGQKCKFWTMIDNEIQAMIICRDHPNIIQIMFAFFTKSEVLCGMEYASKGDLFGFIQSERGLSEDLAKMFFRDIADALLFCHVQGIVHLDVKPENVLIDGFGKAKLSDFGHAIISEDPTNPKSFRLSGCCKGTWVYLAPEMAKEEVDDTRLCDVWSLGVTLMVMLLGYHPFVVFGKLAKAWQGQIDFPCYFPAGPMNLIKRALIVDARKRASMADIVNHKWVTGEALFL